MSQRASTAQNEKDILPIDMSKISRYNNYKKQNKTTYGVEFELLHSEVIGAIPFINCRIDSSGTGGRLSAGESTGTGGKSKKGGGGLHGAIQEMQKSRYLIIYVFRRSFSEPILSTQLRTKSTYDGRHSAFRLNTYPLVFVEFSTRYTYPVDIRRSCHDVDGLPFLNTSFLGLLVHHG